ncbi:hypothetical protein [Novosphingobium sp. Leaf2]|uniref:hypothetical protein n=1 Tax=Novosphingobium sp. Leaf2 TaxID=1735670 RepID=UPI000A9008BB|nr:hypothetical protein [Novosphingobium sp. Leaf2]
MIRNVSFAAIMAAAIAIAAPAHAQGFATKDINAIAKQAARVLGPGYQSALRGSSAAFNCPQCQGEPMVSIAVGRQTDGTEGRVRSGETTMAQLQALCRRREPTCRISRLALGPAVGWLSSWPLGSSAGATAVVLRDGDLLTVRVVANTPQAAAAVMDPLVRKLVPAVVGR